MNKDGKIKGIFINIGIIVGLVIILLSGILSLFNRRTIRQNMESYNSIETANRSIRSELDSSVSGLNEIEKSLSANIAESRRLKNMVNGIEKRVNDRYADLDRITDELDKLYGDIGSTSNDNKEFFDIGEELNSRSRQELDGLEESIRELMGPRSD